MALSERSRSALYDALAGLAGEQATEEMLSHFPARDLEDPVSKEHLDLRLAEFDVRFAEIDVRFAEIDVRFAELRTEMHDGFRRMTLALAGVLGGSLVGGMGLAAGLAAAIG